MPHRNNTSNPFAWPTKQVFEMHGASKTLGRFALAWFVAGPVVGPIMLAQQAHSWWNNDQRDEPAEEQVAARVAARTLEQRFHADRELKRPIALPQTRHRTLSVLNGETQGCLLLSRMPPDITVKIWEYVVSGHTIALFGGNRRLLHYIVPEADGELDEDIDYSQGMPDFPLVSRQTNLSALLKTCRRIYIETIPILYNQNKFIVYQNYTLMDLQSTILPHRFTSIRHLELHFQFRSPLTMSWSSDGTRTLMRPQPAPFSPATWKQICTILSSMTSLCSLFLVIKGTFERNEDIVAVLEGLRTVNVKSSRREKSSFRVRVPWPRAMVNTGDDGIDRRLEDKGYAFEVFRPTEIRPDMWPGFEWARD